MIRHLLFHESPAPLYLGVDNESADEADVYAWLGNELGVEIAGSGEDAPAPASRRGVGSKRCSNQLARESGYGFRYPTFREGYDELIRAHRSD